MKAVVEVTWILAALPGAELVGNHLHMRDGSRIPVTTLHPYREGLWRAEEWAVEINASE